MQKNVIKKEIYEINSQLINKNAIKLSAYSRLSFRLHLNCRIFGSMKKQKTYFEKSHK